ADHPIRVHTDPQSGEPAPYVCVRGNLDALISRAVFYQLVDMAEEVTLDGVRQSYVSSAGQRFVLGTW
ncbi:MAG TPA: DUF1285 domain-containing protein, partial [Candidatus Kapabacteria bacterium]|nr:DUF1285 domain-containing protein [Candidatus Kapabacteria bacterium]